MADTNSPNYDIQILPDDKNTTVEYQPQGRTKIPQNTSDSKVTS